MQSFFLTHYFYVGEMCVGTALSNSEMGLNQSCIKFKKFKRSSIELTFNSSSKFLSFLSFMKEREGNFELELKVSSFELLVNSFELYTALPLTHCGTIRIRKSSSQQEIFNLQT